MTGAPAANRRDRGPAVHPSDDQPTQFAGPAVTIGIDVGGTKVLGLALDRRLDVVGECRRPTPAGGPALAASLVEVVAELRSRVAGVVAVGVGLPGLVERGARLRMAPHLAGVVDLDVAVPLASATGLVVAVDNDATCALVAEHRLGAARGASDAVLVTLGTGIGGGLLLGGRVQRGSSGFAGELGHMVVQPEGRRCPCGGRGCWERYASGQALSVMAGESGDDPEGEVDLHRFAWWVALGLANLVHLLDLERVVVGGGLVGLGEDLLVPVRSAFLERVMAPGQRPPVAILAAQLGERAGAIGAALLARDRLESAGGAVVSGE